jgi:hypothetical protein
MLFYECLQQSEAMRQVRLVVDLVTLDACVDLLVVVVVVVVAQNYEPLLLLWILLLVRGNINLTNCSTLNSCFRSRTVRIANIVFADTTVLRMVGLAAIVRITANRSRNATRFLFLFLFNSVNERNVLKHSLSLASIVVARGFAYGALCCEHI